MNKHTQPWSGDAELLLLSTGGVPSAIETQFDAIQVQVDGKQDILAEGAFIDGYKTKLDGVEALADVTDTANVTSAGALMDSELVDIDSVKAIDQGLSTTDEPYFDRVDIGVNTEALSANKTLTITDNGVQALDPNGSDRNVILPVEADGLMFTICNNGSANTLIIKNDAGTQQGNPVAIGISVTIVSDGTSWIFI